MTSTRAHRFWKMVFGIGLLCGLPLVAAEPAAALPPRSVRIAERIYARQAIAQARAARADALAAEVAKTMPEPPPPRPATLRRMARAGVPRGAPPQAVIAAQEKPPTPQAPAVIQKPDVVESPSAGPSSSTTASRPPVTDPSPGAWTLDPDPRGSPTVDADGTRSVLATGGEAPPKPVASPADTQRPGPAVTQPPIELLPTPAADERS